MSEAPSQIEEDSPERGLEDAAEKSPLKPSRTLKTPLTSCGGLVRFCKVIFF